jgi:hypothetical protein
MGLAFAAIILAAAPGHRTEGCLQTFWHGQGDGQNSSHTRIIKQFQSHLADTPSAIRASKANRRPGDQIAIAVAS